MSKATARKAVKAAKMTKIKRHSKSNKAMRKVKTAAPLTVSKKPLRPSTRKAIAPVQRQSRRAKATEEVNSVKNTIPEPEVIIRTIKRSAAEMKQLRDRLQKLHDLAVDSIGFLAGGRATKSGDSVVGRVNGDGQNTEEDGTESFTQELALMQASNKQDMLNKIIEAFRRLELRTYGVCEQCGDLIAKARIEVQPFASLCIKCQSAAEANRPRSSGFRKSIVQIVDSELN